MYDSRAEPSDRGRSVEKAESTSIETARRRYPGHDEQENLGQDVKDGDDGPAAVLGRRQVEAFAVSADEE